MLTVLDHPTLRHVFTIEKIVPDKNGREPDKAIIEVRFPNHNYYTIIREIYYTDVHNTVWHKLSNNTTSIGFSDQDIIPRLKVIISQLENDGYVMLQSQKCRYFTEYGKEEGCDESGHYDIYKDAKKFVSIDEQKDLETAIILTTKGQNWLSSWRNKIISEPIGLLSLLIAVISLIFST